MLREVHFKFERKRDKEREREYWHCTDQVIRGASEMTTKVGENTLSRYQIPPGAISKRVLNFLLNHYPKRRNRYICFLIDLLSSLPSVSRNVR